jgi:hypothetical protein
MSGLVPDLWDHPVRRRAAGWIVFALMLASVFLPHIAIQTPNSSGRSLIPTSLYFLNVTTREFSPELALPLLGIGLNVTYLGIALQELGLVLAGVSFWIVFGGDEVNRWLWRMMVIAAWLLALSPPAVIMGWSLMGLAGAPVQLGAAWAATMAAGVLLIVLARQSKAQRDFTWYVARPELQ